MSINARKFYKVKGVHSIFNAHDDTYQTAVSDMKQDVTEVAQGYITEHTLLFITADDTDDGKKVMACSINQTPVISVGELRTIHTNDSFMWARGTVFFISGRSITEITKSDGKLNVKYSDNTVDDILLTDIELTEGRNISIDNNTISALGYSYDSSHNFIASTVDDDSEGNAVLAGVDHAFVSGRGNTAKSDDSVVMGAYASVTTDTAFAVGHGTSTTPDNVFDITNTGVGHFKSDVEITGHKLSEIHSVVDSDWYVNNN